MLVFFHLVIYGCNLQGFSFTDLHVIYRHCSVATAICKYEIFVATGPTRGLQDNCNLFGGRSSQQAAE